MYNKNKHRRDVLSKYVNDKGFKIKSAMGALDMSRMGTINLLKNEAVAVLKELNWTVENHIDHTPE